MRGRTYEEDGVEPHWRGIFDDDGRLMVAINFNMDMGDGWELADRAGLSPRLYGAGVSLRHQLHRLFNESLGKNRNRHVGVPPRPFTLGVSQRRACVRARLAAVGAVCAGRRWGSRQSPCPCRATGSWARCAWPCWACCSSRSSRCCWCCCGGRCSTWSGSAIARTWSQCWWTIPAAPIPRPDANTPSLREQAVQALQGWRHEAAGGQFRTAAVFVFRSRSLGGITG